MVINMAKTSGFAALAALQTKIETTPPVDETQDTTDPTSVSYDESQGNFHDVPPVVDLESSGVPEDKIESFASETIEPSISTDVKSVAPAQPVFDAPVEIPLSTKKDFNAIPVDEWSTDELEAYISGDVDIETFVSKLKEAVTEHRKRETTLPKAWSVEECREFLLKGNSPAKTSKGAWVNDVTRKFRREHEWETNELESWALGEIKAEGATTDGGLAVELKQRLNLPLKSVDVQAVITNYRFSTAQVDKARVEERPEPKTPEVSEVRIAEVTKAIQLEGITPVNQSYIDSSLNQFESVMKPGRAITEKSAGDAQRLLRDVMLYAIQLPDPVGARSAMQYLLDYFRSHRAIGKMFEDTYAFRGIPDMRGTKKEQVAHHDLLTLFLVYADPMVELRAQTDVPSLIGNINPQFQSRVLEFFSKV